ncbi:YEATS family protein, related [Neospora caninum Liverpool]|uniref:YEATS family protein, related n=1 Tax=Neospora caninum (strain Liverpool) TaxID=572307 RepID=F0VL82_NEOCL|nr:YEATS family protein, related [Neospora caninum Liverpool]CBZ54834.1 YEATS family protein, related [Neospora caninum Liverpool]CEL69553.1 TPA: YEATS family protein, related [Neospora caninum Liverpool]|eukprot:XP_003884862.1 YEATS family protein, related [Neospora caninum Liverpool]
MPRDRSGGGAPASWEGREDAAAIAGAATGASVGWRESTHVPRSARAHSHAQEGARILKGLTVRKTFVLGSYAFRLSPVEKKKYNDMTHKWTCLLRALNGEDLTYCVKKVVFELDPSFVNPKRTLTHPPYEVSEAGWGEFQISVKLNPEGGHVVGPCVAAETLDEVLIHEPKESFYDVLMEGPHKPAAPHALEKYFLQQQPRFDEQMKLLMGAQGFVQEESMSLMSEAFALTNRIRQLQAACDPRVFQHLRAQQAALVPASPLPSLAAPPVSSHSPPTALAASSLALGQKEALSLATAPPAATTQDPAAAAQTGMQASRGTALSPGVANGPSATLGAGPQVEHPCRAAPPAASPGSASGADVSAALGVPDGAPQLADAGVAPTAETPGASGVAGAAPGPSGASAGPSAGPASMSPAGPYAVVGSAFGAQGADKSAVFDPHALQQQVALQQQQAQALLQQQLYHAQQYMHAAPGAFAAFPGDVKRDATPCPQVSPAPFPQTGPYPNGGAAMPPTAGGVAFPARGAAEGGSAASGGAPQKE